MSDDDLLELGRLIRPDLRWRIARSYLYDEEIRHLMGDAPDYWIELDRGWLETYLAGRGLLVVYQKARATLWPDPFEAARLVLLREQTDELPENTPLDRGSANPRSPAQ